MLARWQQLVCEGGDSETWSDKSGDGEALLIDLPRPAEGPAAGGVLPSPGGPHGLNAAGKRGRGPGPGAAPAAAPPPKRPSPAAGSNPLRAMPVADALAAVCDFLGADARLPGAPGPREALLGHARALLADARAGAATAG